MTKQTKVRRLFADIETAPNIGLFFAAGFDKTINPDAIIQERKIICIGYKWEGEKKVNVLMWDKDRCDRKMIQDFIEVANSADEIVGHFGDRFDWPWIRTRCLMHKLPPLPKWKTVDTKAWASKYFYFNSNKLDYLAQVMGYEGKADTKFKLWKDILLEGCMKSLRYMAYYCGKDVELLEKVYLRLAPYMTPKTHAGVYASLAKWTCPHCGSSRVHKTKTRVTAGGAKQHQMICDSCHAYYQIPETTFSIYLKKDEPAPKKVPRAVRVGSKDKS